MRRLIVLCLAAAVGGGVLAGLACSSSEQFSCQADTECVLVEVAGICVAGDCAYPDATCMSGYRYAVGAKANAEQCVDPGLVPDGGSGTDTE